MNEKWEQRKDRANQNRRAAYFWKTTTHREKREQLREAEAERAQAEAAEIEQQREAEEFYHPGVLAERKRGRVHMKRDIVWEWKSKPCTDCGHSYPPSVMEFDHLNPEEKSFTISRARGKRLEALEAEVAKCDLVCANCHRIREMRRRAGLPATLPPPDYEI